MCVGSCPPLSVYAEPERASPAAASSDGIMALSFKKDLDKYKEIDEDEILNKLSEEELKQLETALEIGRAHV